MDEIFAPPWTPWKAVSPKLVTQRRLFLLLQGLVGGAVLTGAWWVLTGTRWLWAPLVLVVVALTWGMVLVTRNARSWAYAERDEDLYIRHGVMYRRMVVVP